MGESIAVTSQLAGSCWLGHSAISFSVIVSQFANTALLKMKHKIDADIMTDEWPEFSCTVMKLSISEVFKFVLYVVYTKVLAHIYIMYLLCSQLTVILSKWITIIMCICARA